MKKNLKYTMILPLFACAALLFGACGEWTDTESLGVKGPSFPNDDPEAYARYTQALRSYKNHEHAIVYGWFDNSQKSPFSHAQHPASLPDSMDIVSLLHPDNLADWEVAEFSQLREKGTKVIFTFSYADILTAYKATLPPAPDPQTDGGEQPADGFLAFLAAQTDRYLSLVDKYGYDGVSVFYEPAALEFLDPILKAQEQARQAAFLGKLLAWEKAHSAKLLIFEGLPQNLKDKTLLASCDYIVVRAFKASTTAQLNIKVDLALAPGVPSDRLIIGVCALPLDAADLVTGRFADATGALTLNAVTQTSRWVASAAANYNKAGLGIYNIQNDYYNTSLIYMYTRGAISEMNPAPKI